MRIPKLLILILIVVSMCKCDFSGKTSVYGQFIFNKELVDSLPFNLKEYNDSIRIQDSNEPWITFERIDSSGQFVVVDDYEGSISGFYFYSSQKEKLGEYRPYNFFGFTKYCYNETDFFLVALNDEDSDSIKIAHLKHDGELIKELSIKNPFSSLVLRDLKISGNNLILLLNHLNEEFKIIAFDFELNELWNQTSEHFVYYDGVNSNLKNSDLIISDEKCISKFNSNTGKKIWTYYPFDSTETNKVYKTTLLLENRFIGLFKFQGVEKENHDYSYTNCDLTILDVKDGQKIYSENLFSSQNDIILFNNNYPNINPNEFYFQRGDSTWRYKYLIKN